MGEKHANKVIAVAQAQIAEPVLAAAEVNPKGRAGARTVGGVAGIAMHAAKSNNHAFPGLSVFAITEHALHAFSASHTLSLKLKEPIGAWPWGTFGASTSKGKFTQFLYLTWEDGVVHDLEVLTRGVTKFQGAFVDEVVRRSAAAGAYPPPAG
jgi:hypothetical protein